MSVDRLHLLACTVLLSLAALGCGGGSGAAPAPSLTAADLAADEAAMAAVETVWASASGQSLYDQAVAVQAAMKANPQFTASGIASDNTAWGVLKDGTVFAVGTNDVGSDDVITPAVAAPIPLAAPGPAAGELPASRTAYVFNALEATRNVPDAAIAANLKAAGYSVTASTGSIADWLGVSQAGLLFNASHGFVVQPNGDGVEVFFLETSDLYKDGDMTYNALRAAKVMAVVDVPVLSSSAAPGVPPVSSGSERHWMFSSGFLKTAGMFAGNSLMFNMACSGLSSSGIAFAKSLSSTNGLAVYGGWSKPSNTYDGDETSSFFFDRALGLNQFAPVDPSSPPPADWASILNTMQNTNRASGVGYNLATSVPADSEKSSVAAFSIQNLNGSGLTTLVPSISGYTVDQAGNTLTLQGSFGSGQGSVTLDGSALTVNAWSTSAITTVLPTAFTGQLKVSSPQSLVSNLFPYNQPNPWIGVWAGSLTSGCGYYAGPLTVTISSTGGNGLQFTLGGGFSETYTGSFTGNTATSTNGAVQFTLSGNSLTAVETDSCQEGTFTRQ